MDSPVLQRWLIGVELGARGLYGQAEAIAAELIADVRAPIKVLGETLLASHRRQLGDHRCARVHDNAGLRAWEAADLDPDWPYVDLLVNRAADAIGLRELDDAGLWLAKASALAEAGDLRTAVRFGWVSAELALATDDPGTALRLVDELALPLARLRSRRHGVKTRLIRAVALDALGERHGALTELERVMADAADRHWHSLVWPAALVHGRLATNEAEREASFGIARSMVELIRLDLHPARAAAFEQSLPAELRSRG